MAVVMKMVMVVVVMVVTPLDAHRIIFPDEFGGTGSKETTAPTLPLPPPYRNHSLPPDLQDAVRGCGVTLQENHLRIRGGSEALKFRRSWTLLLRGRESSGREAWSCGASLITLSLALTAASCLHPHPVAVRVGEHRLGEDPECDTDGHCARAEDVPVEEVIVHPHFNVSCTGCNDLALLRLARDVGHLHPVVVPICLPLTMEDKFGPYLHQLQDSNYHGTSTGWGTVGKVPFASPPPEVMETATMRFTRTPFCESFLSGLSAPSSALCAGTGGKDSCRGDLGGPLAFLATPEGPWVLLGVRARTGRPCGDKDAQPVFTSVFHHLPWILEHM